MTYAQKYKTCLTYIDLYWDKIIIHPEKTGWKSLLRQKTKDKRYKQIWNVPHAFVAPNDKKFKNIFYWDSFFMLKGLIGTKREWVLKDMVDNFVFLFNNYGVIPNFNSPASSGRSQPPFLTSMILDTYNGPLYRYVNTERVKRRLKELKPFKEWLREVTEVAKKEYFDVWDDENNLFYHKVASHDLNRYGDRDVGYAHSSELESGWDFTSRFYNRCNEFLPIDLNSYLYKYETDFAKIADYLGDKAEAKKWTLRSEERKERINKYLWNEKEGFFFDHNYKYERQSEFYSLASFVPLWAGIATQKQAERMVKKLPLYETASGLTITAKESLAPHLDLESIPVRHRIAVEDVLKPKQWDYPYIWPPLEYLTVIGLLRYGFIVEAKRIMESSLQTQARIFKKHKTFFEKTSAVTDDRPGDFHYKNQSGFGWTNATFYRYVKILDSLAKGETFAEIQDDEESVFRSDMNAAIFRKFTRKKI